MFLISALQSDPESEQQWESFNRWSCFDVSKIKLTCAVYDEATLVPSIEVYSGNDVLLFDTHVEDRFDCNQTLTKWQSLMSERGEVCLFAAEVPNSDLDSDSEQFLFYLARIRGAGGYWDVND